MTNKPESATSNTIALSTFRDPDGRVEIQEDAVLRHVHAHAREQALAILATDFYRKASAAGDMVASASHEEISGLVLEHPRVFFPSYSWEWTPSQWLAAGELTLQLCEQAIPEGWILKDATPLNVLFEGARPIFVDVLSFERRNPRSSIWIAHAQFVQTFILPLMAKQRLGWPLASSLSKRDGVTPEELLPSLPFLASMRPAVFWNVTLPALIERRSTVSEEKIENAKAHETAPEIATALLLRRIGKLRKQLHALVGKPDQTRWSQYQHHLGHYDEADQQRKRAFVQECLENHRPAAVLDIGANTGTYSLLAADSGARVVSLDLDESSMALLHQKALAESKDIQPLVVNIARPTPSVGWFCREQLSFIDRAKGRFDLVMMLAVIHHLLLAEQIPLGHIAILCAALTKRWLIVEWVPAEDPMFRQLLRGRGDLYGHLTQAALVDAFSPYFNVGRVLTLNNGRELYWFEKKA